MLSALLQTITPDSFLEGATAGGVAVVLIWHGYLLWRKRDRDE